MHKKYISICFQISMKKIRFLQREFDLDLFKFNIGTLTWDPYGFRQPTSGYCITNPIKFGTPLEGMTLWRWLFYYRSIYL